MSSSVSVSVRATESPETVLDGGASLGTTTVNQQVSPNDFAVAGAWWEQLGEFDIASGTLQVNLSDNANGRLNADAVRIELLEPFVTGSSFIESTQAGGNQLTSPFWLDLDLHRSHVSRPAREVSPSMAAPLGVLLRDLAFARGSELPAEKTNAQPRRGTTSAAARELAISDWETSWTVGRRPWLKFEDLAKSPQ